MQRIIIIIYWSRCLSCSSHVVYAAVPLVHIGIDSAIEDDTRPANDSKNHFDLSIARCMVYVQDTEYYILCIV